MAHSKVVTVADAATIVGVNLIVRRHLALLVRVVRVPVVRVVDDVGGTWELGNTHALCESPPPPVSCQSDLQQISSHFFLSHDQS